ncbi:BET1-like protein isoform X1 [Meriones unguiculatus]|uniref:BET1-like protein isoform X1 n=1 Tax=Meriones unguiculatus TaxID=10047 RepID=UPI000B4F486C|nr:BET1-like protein isoform X1 [Meriones unguiculatus]
MPVARPSIIYIPENNSFSVSSAADRSPGSPPEAEPEDLFGYWCHVRRCFAESLSGTSEGAMADWTRTQSSGAVEEIIDRENKRMADSLASKVTRLKSLALDIDRDTDDQNRYLDSMDSDFSSVTGLLTGSVKRFSTVARSGRDNRKLLCGMALVLIVAFFILSYLLSRTRT